VLLGEFTNYLLNIFSICPIRSPRKLFFSIIKGKGLTPPRWAPPTHHCRPTLAAVGRAAAAPCARREVAAAAPPPSRAPPAPLPPPTSAPPSLPPPAPPPSPPIAAAALARLLGGGSRAHPALLCPCALQQRVCTLRIGPLLASDWRRSSRPFCLLIQTAATRSHAALLLIGARLCCSRVAGCGSKFELGFRKPGWRLKSRKIKSGGLPEFQVALLAL
jgi:hypothetical protein